MRVISADFGMGPLCTCVPQSVTKSERKRHKLGKRKRSLAEKPQFGAGALSLHREGRQFEPVIAHHKIKRLAVCTA